MTRDMTTGRPLPLMTRFALPLLAANVLQLLYTVADSAIIGRLLGVNAFAAVGAAFSPHWLIFSTILGIAHGFGILFAQRFGAKDRAGLQKAFFTAICLAAVLGSAIALLGVFFRVWVLNLLGTPEVLLADASLYIGILFGGMPITFAFNTLGAALHAQGDSKSPFIATMAASLLNIALGLVSVILFGIAGAAASTLLAQLFACAYCYRALRKTGLLKGIVFKFDGSDAKELLRLGLPLGLQNAVTEVGGLVVQFFVNEYGPEFVAGIAAAKRMYSLLVIAGGAVEASVATFVAQNFGMGNHTRIRQGVRTGFGMMFASAALVMPAALLFGRQILSLLVTGEAEQLRVVLDVGTTQLSVLALGLPALLFLLLYRSALLGVGNSVIPMLSGFLEMAMRIAIVIFMTPTIGEWAVYLSTVLGWGLAAVLLAGAYLRFRSSVARTKQG